MWLILRTLKQISLMTLVILLSQCTNVTALPIQPIQHKLVSPYRMSAAEYLALAKNQAGLEQQALMLLAAGRLIHDHQWREGYAIVSQLNPESVALVNEKKLLLASVDMIKEQPHAAITKLESVRDTINLPIYYQVQFHEMLAFAYQSVGKIIASVMERIKLDPLLPNEKDKINNRRLLWFALTTLPKADLDNEIAHGTHDTILDGWLQLAHIAITKHDTPSLMIRDLDEWQAHYPGHPGHSTVPSPIKSAASHLFSRPKQVALMLPLTGPFARPASAIKEGFLAALKTDHATNAIKIREYNTDSVPIEALYQQAIDDGADYVVGPLLKANVAKIAMMDHPVPTLLLNDIESRPHAGAYQFGLSQQHEARQVAIKAGQHGYARALVIAPDGAWGDEALDAFTSQWREQGRRVADVLHYRSSDDLNLLLRNFLQISDSEAREKRLKQLIGSNIEATPTRRQDFDVIFLVAYPSKARQIMPLLKYYYAGDIPVYATSIVYAGNIDVMRDRDLDGIIFCDMPSILTGPMDHKNWPEQFNSYSRLYALGRDSYALTTELNQLLLFPAIGLIDQRGALYLNPSQHITRSLSFGQFKQGLVHVMVS